MEGREQQVTAGGGGDLPLPKEQIVVAMVQLLNLEAQAAGVNGKLTNRALKTLLKFRNRSFGRPSFLQIVQQVSKGRDNHCPKFDVDKITQIRSSFLSQGMVTIHASSTAIMIKEAKPDELEELIKAIRLAQKITAGTNGSTTVQDNDVQKSPLPSATVMSVKGQSIKPATESITSAAGRRKSDGARAPTTAKVAGNAPTTSTKNGVLSSGRGQVQIIPGSKKVNSKAGSSSSSSSSYSPLVQSRLNFYTLTPEERVQLKALADATVMENKGQSLRRSGSNKRPRSPSPNRGPTPQEKRAMKTKGRDVIVKITSKLGYIQHGFSSANPTHLTISAISLKRLDSRLLALNCLRHLDLSNNSLVNVNSLRQLPSTLDTLKLSHNRIESLDSRLRFPWSRLTFLDLSHNKLKVLPESFVYLSKVRCLDVSHNELRVLPYNLHLMGSLRTLLVNANQLQSLPQPFSIGLCCLAKLDLSQNPGLKKPQLYAPSLPLSLSPGWGTSPHDSSIPSSLQEMSAAVVLATNNATETAFVHLKDGAVPDCLMEYLYRAKRCGACRQLVTRYVFKDNYSGVGRTIAQEVICDGPADSVRTAYCPHHYIP